MYDFVQQKGEVSCLVGYLLANDSQQAKSCPQLVSVSKVLLAHSHAHLFYILSMLLLYCSGGVE